jgi:hypothetical protein
MHSHHKYRDIDMYSAVAAGALLEHISYVLCSPGLLAPISTTGCRKIIEERSSLKF